MLTTNQPNDAATLQAVTEAAHNTFGLLYGERLSAILAGLDSKTQDALCAIAGEAIDTVAETTLMMALLLRRKQGEQQRAEEEGRSPRLRSVC